MNIGILKTVGVFLGKTALQIIKIGAWGVVNQYTQEQYRDSSREFIGEMKRGAEHQAVKLKLIKND